ncbi:aspartate aminotransferase family protein [Flavobacteriaceae bacterium]|nr:aspartate aminotransferase family protein [Flavobacteriaceae bacterium]MDC1321071.1 aspartate aminotransferase family protein [Flavobacteriaceae bacterium]
MKKEFHKYQAQVTPHPLEIEVDRAIGCYIYDTNNKKYLDFIAGVSACSLGHCHPKVIKAIKKQLDKYLHVMVYGEFILQPAVDLTRLLSKHLPKGLDSTYLTNSGTEAIEGAIKLARRYTGRREIIGANNAYHGSTLGALTLMGKIENRKPFEPLLPEVNFIDFNNLNDINKITHKTAGVILETIQGAAGFIEPENDYLKLVSDRCNEVGALLILDEIQPGIGRTGKLFGFENYNCIPDIIVSGKGLGGGMPIGAFISSKKIMSTISNNPKLGHITTFGGNPVIAASAYQTLKIITETDLIKKTLSKEIIIRNKLKHPLIKKIRGRGLMLAIILESVEIADRLVIKAKKNGLLLFWLLIEKRAVRITPPLTITEKDISLGCDIIIQQLNNISRDVN